MKMKRVEESDIFLYLHHSICQGLYRNAGISNRNVDISQNVEKLSKFEVWHNCRKLSRRLLATRYKFEMSRIWWSSKMSRNVQKCRRMSKSVEECPKSDEKYQKVSNNVEECLKVPENVRKSRNSEKKGVEQHVEILPNLQKISISPKLSTKKSIKCIELRQSLYFSWEITFLHFRGIFDRQIVTYFDRQIVTFRWIAVLSKEESLLFRILAIASTFFSSAPWNCIVNFNAKTIHLLYRKTPTPLSSGTYPREGGEK